MASQTVSILSQSVLALIPESSKGIAKGFLDQLVLASHEVPVAISTQTAVVEQGGYQKKGGDVVIRYKKDGTPCKKPGPKPKAQQSVPQVQQTIFAPAPAIAAGVRLKKDGTPCKRPGPKPGQTQAGSTSTNASYTRKTGIHQCESITKSGNQCKNMAYLGQKYCQVHC